MAFKPSGNPRVLELTKSCKERTCNLDQIRPIKLEELNSKGKQRKLCAWCATEEIFHGNQKYCSNGCSRSAEAWAYPQKEESLRFLLIRQDWKCIDCKFDYTPVMQACVDSDLARHSYDNHLASIPHADLPFYYFKRLKSKAPKDRKPEIDHEIPIYKGGQSIGLENIRCLCYTCHKAKTKLDLSGKRDK